VVVVVQLGVVRAQAELDIEMSRYGYQKKQAGDNIKILIGTFTYLYYLIQFFYFCLFTASACFFFFARPIAYERIRIRSGPEKLRYFLKSIYQSTICLCR
jgi:hypothetical protein